MGKKEPKEEPKRVKQRIITMTTEKEDTDMEEGKHSSRGFMPNLPKPLTDEEKKYLLAVERGDLSTVRKMLQKSHRHPEFMNKNCVDPMGRGALHMAIDNENLEMVEMLVVMGVETKDALLHAINVEFVEAVEVLLEHEEVIHKEGESYSWEKVDRQTAAFTPEITPLILAAHRDNYEILKILLDRGATLPMPHDIRCGCQECIRSSAEDSLRHSMSRINSYRALASPSLIALSSTDPILTAFELSWELKTLAYSEQEFRSQYLELRTQCRNFAEALLSHTRSSTELAVILNYDPDSPPYEDGEHMKLTRLELAIDYKQKKFVAHPNVQQLLAAIWYEGLPGFRRKDFPERLLEIIKVALLFPMYCVHYMVMPESPTGKLMRTPFMKFLIHSSSYLFFLLLLILVSVRFEDQVIYFLGTERMRKSLEEANSRPRGNFSTPTEVLVFLYVFGFLFEEIQEIKIDGIRKYFKNMWNILDVLRDTLYITTIFLKIGAYIQQNFEISENPRSAYTPKEEWSSFDPQLISEGLFSAANILSALKLVHIFSINPYLGPLQISLGRMVIDIVKFFFIYSLVLFSFACGLTQLLWYYNDLEKKKCYSLQGGLPDWVKQGDACMKWRRFHNLFEATQSLFWAGFGMVGLSDFELTGIREYTRFWSMLMFGTFSVINIIVLLNLLIAMMSSSYSFIVEHADTEWKFARTKLWMSYFEEGRTLPPPFNIFPNIKLFRKYFGSNEKEQKFRRMSTRTQNIRRKVRDYRYLGVMRALIWRYICSMQTRNLESPVTEDNINEVKGDISALKFELIDIFGQNGMDVAAYVNKSKAALGRKMRIWERRLMRDFHVSPAMGTEEASVTPPIEESKVESPDDASAMDRFRRVAKLAMIAKVADVASPGSGKSTASQIGKTNLHDDTGRETLKQAMEKARKKMEEGTPDGSPTSSRGCSPYPDIYTGPHLLDAIKNLDLSPSASPMPPENTFKFTKNGREKEISLLNVQGYQDKFFPKDSNNLQGLLSVNTLKGNSKTGLTCQDGKSNSSKPSKSTCKDTKKLKSESEVKNIPPVTVSTISELSSPQPKKETETQKKENKESAKDIIKETPPKSEIVVKQSILSQNKECISQTRQQLGERDSSLFKTEKNLIPSSIKTGKYQSSFQNPPSKSEVVKPTALRIDSCSKSKQALPNPSIARPRPQGITPTTAKIPSITPITFKQPLEQRELQNTEIIRKPKIPQKLDPTNKPNITNKERNDKNNSKTENESITPKISISPSTPIISPTPKMFLKQQLNEKEVKLESPANRSQLECIPEYKHQNKPKKDETSPSDINSKNSDKELNNENSEKIIETSSSPDSVQDMKAPLITPETSDKSFVKDRETTQADKSEDKPSLTGDLPDKINTSANEEKDKLKFKSQVKQESIEDKGIVPTKSSSRNWF